MFHKLQKSSISSRSISRFSCLKGVDSISLAFISITALTTVCFSSDLCPSSWKFSKYSGTCVRFYFHRQRNWQNARKTCGEYHSDLVAIQNMDHNNYLHAMIRSSEKGFWVGLNDLKRPGTYTWLDSNEQPTFLNWWIDQPNVPEHQCVQINNVFGKATREWTDDDCGEEINFICERNRVITDKCPSEWIWSVKAGTCMRIFRDERSWHSAKEHCGKYKAELLMILNEETNHFLQEFLSPHDESFWIGLSNLEDQNTYRWLDYADELTFNKWATNPYVQETKCAHVKNPQQGWNIADCEQKKKFICEKYLDNCFRVAEAKCPVNCSSSCQDNVCNRRTGVCTLGCVEGFKEPLCVDLCARNTYGKACNSTCNPNCGGPDKACNFTTGICLHGCSADFSGPFCSNHTPMHLDDIERSSNSLAPVGGILSFLLLATLILLLLAKKKTAKEGEQGDGKPKPTQSETEDVVIEEAEEELVSEAPRRTRQSTMKGLKDTTDVDEEEDLENNVQPYADS